MKKSLLLFMTICCHLLIAESYYQSSYQSYNYFSTFDTQFHFQHKLNQDYSLIYDTNYTKSSNLSFKRSSKTVNSKYILAFEKYIYQPYLSFDYAGFYNSGLPEADFSINDKKLSKVGVGYQAALLQNKLHMKQNGNYIKLANPVADYFGWDTYTQILWLNSFRKHSIDTGGYIALQDIFLDKNSSQGVNFDYTYSDKSSFQVNLRYSYFTKDHYAYDIYEDKSYRNDTSSEIRYNLFITDNIDWKVSNKLNYKKIDYSQNTRRNSWSFENDMQNRLDYYTDNSTFYTKVRYVNNERFTKSFTLDRGDNRFYSEEKALSCGMFWRYTYLDSVKVEITNSILSNQHSETSKNMDNDMVMSCYEISGTNFFGNHRVDNTILISQGEHIYIHHSLSAYNHEKLSFVWKPSTELKMNEYFYFLNKYQISADYQYYKWTEYIRDRLYRMNICEWGMLYSTNKEKHYSPYMLTPKYDIDIYFAFELENIETAENIDKLWLLSSSTYQRQYFFTLDFVSQHYQLFFKPVLKYYKKTYEAEVQSDFWISLKDFQVFTSINPIGKQFNRMIWKYNIGVALQF